MRQNATGDFTGILKAAALITLDAPRIAPGDFTGILKASQYAKGRQAVENAIGDFKGILKASFKAKSGEILRVVFG